jgi:POT family proton-dependent oligopeptide transporter
MDSRPPAEDAFTQQPPPPAVRTDQITALPSAPAAPPPNGDAAAPTAQGHPPAIWFFFWGEFAERSSYYGMRAILFLYMTTALVGLNGQHLADTDAGPIYAAFKMACYFLPLVGGFIADRWLGRYWTIIGFSVPYVLGHFILGIPTEPAMFIALALLAGGSGVIKPNISTLMGQTYDQKRPGQERLRSAAFLWFYFAINVGALISQLALPEIRNQYIYANLTPEARAEAVEAAAKGEDVSKFASDEVRQRAYAIAFQFPAWLMVLSLTIFALGKPFYAKEVMERRVLTREERRLQWQTLGRLFAIFALVVLFWFGYEHNDTLWVAFTRDYVDLRLPFVEKTIAPDQLQFLNALFVILLVPTFTFLFAYFDPKVKVFTAMRKVLAGFVLTAAAIGIMSAAGFLAQAHPGEKVSMLWPAAAYIVLTFGEVLLYGTMLELAYTAAPKSMKGFITACFLVTNALGNFLNIPWTRMYGGSLTDEAAKRGPLTPGVFFGLTALVVVAAAVAFVFIGKRFERIQAEAAAAGVT